VIGALLVQALRGAAEVIGVIDASLLLALRGAAFSY